MPPPRGSRSPTTATPPCCSTSACRAAPGLGVLQSMRQRYDPTPVLIVTARDSLSDRIAGLDAGADHTP